MLRNMEAGDGSGGRRMIFSIDVTSPPEQVFALVSDIERHGEWSPQEFEATRVDDGPILVGSRYRTAGRKGARKGTMRATDVVVTEFMPPSRFAFAATEKAGTYRTTFVIQPTATGSQVDRIVDPPTTGVVAFIRHELLRSVVRTYVQKNMDALSALLNGTAK
jgi:uncharacterized protein YndB with AHSA1/START domain